MKKKSPLDKINTTNWVLDDDVLVCIFKKGK